MKKRRREENGQERERKKSEEENEVKKGITDVCRHRKGEEEVECVGVGVGVDNG